MIKLTRLNGKAFTLNAELIETLEAAAQSTVVSLASNNRFNVLESVDDIIERVVQYRAKIHSKGKAVNPIKGFERA